MAIRIPIISDFQDQGIKNAKIAFGNFKTAVGDAEGGLGKFKAGSKSIWIRLPLTLEGSLLQAELLSCRLRLKGLKRFKMSR